MNRPVSPLLHDYKQPVSERRRKPKALQWFAVGLGIPLVTVALFNVLGNEGSAESPSGDTRLITEAVLGAPPGESVSIPVVEDPELVLQTAAVLPEPEPQFEKLLLNVGRGDTMEKLFRQNNLNVAHLLSIAQLDEAKKQFRRIKPGDVFEVTHDEGAVVSLYAELSLTRALQVERNEDGFAAELIDRPIEIRKREAYGVIQSSLYESAADAGLSDKVIMNIAGIFAWDVDFVLDIRKGDNYYVQYEEIWQDGEFVTDGEITVAEFNNNGQTSTAVRFIDDNGRADYFTPDGRSVRKAFLRSPVDFRVSSRFNPNRLHPVLKTRRPHRGVDYAAPHGTPIKASGDGKVIFRGVKSGYGNVVILQHGGNITTLYAHMSRFASSVRSGSRVRQGQTVGYVGKTGLVTGVHLHYEYRVNGVHRNPTTVDLPDAEPIAEKYRQRFMATAEPVLKELEAFKSNTTDSQTVAYNTSQTQ